MQFVPDVLYKASSRNLGINTQGNSKPPAPAPPKPVNLPFPPKHSWNNAY